MLAALGGITYLMAVHCDRRCTLILRLFLLMPLELDFGKIEKVAKENEIIK
jgi:hypothetical protein